MEDDGRAPEKRRRTSERLVGSAGARARGAAPLRASYAARVVGRPRARSLAAAGRRSAAPA